MWRGERSGDGFNSSLFPIDAGQYCRGAAVSEGVLPSSCSDTTREAWVLVSCGHLRLGVGGPIPTLEHPQSHPCVHLINLKMYAQTRS